MTIDILTLYQALRQGSAAGAAGSALFGKLLRGASKDAIRRDAHLAGQVQFIAEERDGFLRRDIPHLPWSLYKLYDTTGDRGQFQDPYFERRRRLLILCLSVWLWERPEDISALEDCIWAICDEYSWCLPAHMAGTSLLPPGSTADSTINGEFGGSAETESAAQVGGLITDNRIRLDLFACETAFALAECCAMLDTTLNGMVLDRARSEVTRRVIDSYREHGGLWNWELMSNNWCAVVAGSIAGAALYLIEDDLLLAGLLAKLLPVLDRYLESFTVEGVCAEGLSYWTYGMSFFVSAADLLLLRSGGGVDLFTHPRIEAIAGFQQHCYFPGNGVLHFSDMNDGDLFRPGLSCYLAERVPLVTLPAIPYRRSLEGNFDHEALNGPVLDYCGRFCAGLRDLLWTRADAPLTGEGARSVVFPVTQWLLCSGAEGTGFAAKGGHNGESHNHNDVGNCIYYRNGRMILCDLGAGEYNKDYFGKGRYDVLCTNSFGHNVPIIDGKGQKAGAEYGVRSCVFGAEGEVTMDMAPAYGNNALASLERRFRFDTRTGLLVLRDTFGFADRPLPVTERLVTLIEPCVEDGVLFIPDGDGPVFITLNEPAVTGKPVAPVVGREIHRRGGRETTVYTIDYAFTPAGAAFTVELVIGRKPHGGHQ
jgi:hypothetical protein